MLSTSRSTRWTVTRHPNGLKASEGLVVGAVKIGEWAFFNTSGRPTDVGKFEGGEQIDDWMRIDWDKGVVYRQVWVNGRRIKEIRLGNISPRLLKGMPDGLAEVLANIQRMPNLR